MCVARGRRSKVSGTQGAARGRYVPMCRDISIFFSPNSSAHGCSFQSPNKWPKCRFQKFMKLSKIMNQVAGTQS